MYLSGAIKRRSKGAGHEEQHVAHAARGSVSRSRDSLPVGIP